MALVDSKETLEEARKEGYAVPQFNGATLETILAIIKTAKKFNSPVILGTSEGEISHSSEEIIASMVEAVSKKEDFPVTLHLDHGSTFENVKKCIDAGYTSVHIDASHLPFEENIELTKKVVDFAHEKGVQVEGELGKVTTPKSNNEKIDRAQFFTDPSKVAEFITRTGVDSLAISVGTAHGAYKGNTEIDFELLKKIGEVTSTPLVLHGASLVSESDIQRAISLGVSKVNINTELRFAFTNSIRETLKKHPEEYVPHKIFDRGIAEMEKVCEDKIKMFKSLNRN